MAQVVGANQIKLDNGQVITPNQGGWYDGQQYWGGSLSAPGQIHAESDQQGAGENVSDEVIAQTAPENVPYIHAKREEYNPPATPSVPWTPDKGYAPSGSTAPSGDMVGLGESGVPNLQEEYPMC